MLWQNFPEELRLLNQWTVTGPDNEPSIEKNGLLIKTSPVNGPWYSFSDAFAVAAKYKANIQFIITANSPYSCIDLDVKDIESVDKLGRKIPESKWTTVEELEGYCNAVEFFNSYAEVSAGGKGLHIWVKGKVKKNIKRAQVEIFSGKKAIVCTGKSISQLKYSIENKVVRLHPIDTTIKIVEDRQEQLSYAYNELGAGKGSYDHELTEEPEILADHDIFNIASNTVDEFNNLCNIPEGNTDWLKYGYDTQSEADYALLSILAYNTPSNNQIRRLFRQTNLGKRDKAVKNDVYINTTLKPIRSKQILQHQIKEQSVKPVKEPPKRRIEENEEKESLQYPPGFGGVLAQTIFNTGTTPVKEIAITAALGFMAGIAGKAYNTPTHTGLNLYLILIGMSGVGKELLHDGPSMLALAISKRLPQILNYISSNEIASGPALLKTVAAQQCMLNISGEWGQRFRQLADEKSFSGPMYTFKKTMTMLYSKSGGKSIVGGMSYSDKDKNTKSVNGVAYSMVGDTTAEPFYQSMTQAMMEDGFMSRFNVIEYSGTTPPINEYPLLEIPDQITNYLCQIFERVLKLTDRNAICTVSYCDESHKHLNEFYKECVDKANKAANNPSVRQMWVRAHLKSLRLSSLLAVFDNPTTPVISLEDAVWSTEFIIRDINNLTYRMSVGDVGITDHAREMQILKVIKEYLKEQPKKSYRIPKNMRESGIIPRRYIQNRVKSNAPFTKHPLQANKAIDITLQSLCDSGYIQLCDKDITLQYGAQGKCYNILIDKACN